MLKREKEDIKKTKVKLKRENSIFEVKTLNCYGNYNSCYYSHHYRHHE